MQTVSNAVDDFELILGMDFLLAANVSVMPRYGGIFIGDEKQPCFVRGILEKWDKGKTKDGLLSALQVEAGLKRGEVTYLAALVEVKPDQMVEVPDSVAEILREFDDVMPSELPKSLPPRRAVDHKIELEPGARPPAQAPY